MALHPLPTGASDEASGVESGLMAVIASGSQSAFAQLYDLTCAQIFGLILSVIPSRRAAEDVLQESYLHVWSHAADFDAHRGDARTWISGIAHRCALQRARSAATDAASATPLLDDGPPSGGAAAVA